MVVSSFFFNRIHLTVYRHCSDALSVCTYIFVCLSRTRRIVVIIAYYYLAISPILLHRWFALENKLKLYTPVHPKQRLSVVPHIPYTHTHTPRGHRSMHLRRGGGDDDDWYNSQRASDDRRLLYLRDQIGYIIIIHTMLQVRAVWFSMVPSRFLVPSSGYVYGRKKPFTQGSIVIW